jgi:hypothetical protein
MKIVISSGHGRHVRGAHGIIDEVREARRVVHRTAACLTTMGVGVIAFSDDTSTTQQQNLKTIVDFHNSHARDLDVSVHFNAFEPTDGARGTECLYLTQSELAAALAEAIAEAGGLKNRGAKYYPDLYFLNNTDEPAVLVEVCFVDAKEDVAAYDDNFELICAALARVLAGGPVPRGTVTEVPVPRLAGTMPVLFIAYGPCSSFGGPADPGVSPSEGLAFIYEYDERPDLFLKKQPAGTTGLARRLDPKVHYIACRWDYSRTPKEMLRDKNLQAMVAANDRSFLAWPADWGPAQDTGRVADLSPGLMEALGITTDDDVQVAYPWTEDRTA